MGKGKFRYQAGLWIFCALLIGLQPARAAVVTVYGGPTYDATTQTGYLGVVQSEGPFDVNLGGTAVGFSEAYVAGTDLGQRAARWDANGTTILDGLGTDSSGATDSYAFAINATGTSVGMADKYSGNTSSGYRAVRWDAGGTAATELGNLGVNASGTIAMAAAINDAGTAVGMAYKYTGNTLLGQRAVRWDAGGTSATELGNLGTDSSGMTNSQAYAVNSSGVIVGSAYKYNGDKSLGRWAVRWDAGGTAATELGALGTDASGSTFASTLAVNDSGTAVGLATKYDAGHINLGSRAVRWDAGTTAGIELGNLGTAASGGTTAQANAINNDGEIVGYCERYDGGTDIGRRAVLWGSDGVAIDLNTLIDPGSGWTLTEADGISDGGFIVGLGRFDPDGVGPEAAYFRAFVLQAPEPAGLLLTLVGGVSVLGRRRFRRPRQK